MRTLGLLVLASCATPPRSPPETLVAERPLATTDDENANYTIITQLEVTIVDHRSWASSGANVRPTRIEIVFDSKPIGTIEIPCSTALIVPGRTYKLARFAVPPGWHTLQVRDLDRATVATSELRFPYREPFAEGTGFWVGEKLFIDTDETKFTIHPPRAIVMRL